MRPSSDAGLPLHWHQAQLRRQLFCRSKRMAVHHRQQIATHLRADCRDALEQGHILFQVGMAINVLVYVLLQFGKLLLQKVDTVHNG